MVCTTKTLIPLLVAAGLSCLAGNSLAAPTTKLGSSWFKAAFETRFPPALPSLPPAEGSVVLYKNKADPLGEERSDAFQPVSKELNVALSASSTSNPFRKLFPTLYSEANIAKRLECPVLGVPFELDDKPASKEWVVSFSALQCLGEDEAEKLRSGDTEAHKWVIQQGVDGKYRVLAEGDGSLYVTNQHKEQGYKEIRTHLLLKRAYPADELRCGGADLTWRYRNNNYYLAATEYMAQDCQPLYFPELTGEAWQNAYDEYERRVKLLVDAWVGQLQP